MLGYKDNTNTLCIQLGGENIGELFINKEGQLTFNGDIHKSAQAFAEELKRIFRTSNEFRVKTIRGWWLQPKRSTKRRS